MKNLLKVHLDRWYLDETLYEVKKEFRFKGRIYELRVLADRITCRGKRVVDIYDGYYRGYTAIVDKHSGEVIHSVNTHPKAEEILYGAGKFNQGTTLGLEMGIAIFED